MSWLERVIFAKQLWTHTHTPPHPLGAKGSLGRICMGEFGLPEQKKKKKTRPNPNLRRWQMTGPPHELVFVWQSAGSRRFMHA